MSRQLRKPWVGLRPLETQSRRDNVDTEKIRAAVSSLIEAIGENPQREGIQNTPQRVAEMYSELFSGIGQDPCKELTVGFEEGHHEMVIVRDIPFYSMCEHHLLPFYGVAHIAEKPVELKPRSLRCFAGVPGLGSRASWQRI
jgi:GTP cyclohydrolase IA